MSSEKRARDYLEEIESQLKNRFDGEGEVRFFRACGRLDWLGSHTDYNLGLILASTVDREIIAGARLREDGVLNLYTLNLEQEIRLNIDQLFPDPAHSWANYPKGIISELKASGIEVPGLDLVVYSEIPIGANLSSSAALEAVSLEAILGLLEAQMSRWERIQLCYRAENNFVGMPCGILDQFTVYQGQKDTAIYLDCDTLYWEKIPVQFEQIQLLVVDSGRGRELVKSEYSRRREECGQIYQILRENGYKIAHLSQLKSEDLKEIEPLLDEVLFRRLRHIITENQRVKKARGLLLEKNYPALGELFTEGYLSSSRDYENSLPELDILAKLLNQLSGLLGLRIAGAGWGGCMVTLVRGFNPEEMEVIKRRYQEKTGLEMKYFLVETGDIPGELER